MTEPREEELEFEPVDELQIQGQARTDLDMRPLTPLSRCLEIEK